jgi:hypothetical protein
MTLRGDQTTLITFDECHMLDRGVIDNPYRLPGLRRLESTGRNAIEKLSPQRYEHYRGYVQAGGSPDVYLHGSDRIVMFSTPTRRT